MSGPRRLAGAEGGGAGYSAAVRLLCTLEPLDRLALAGDTSYALMLEAAARGWEVWTCQIEHLGLVGDDAVCDAVPTTVVEAARPSDAFRVGEPVAHRL